MTPEKARRSLDTPAGLTLSRVSTQEQLKECWSIRLDVFVGEQAVPIEEEIDEADLEPTTSHVLATDAATGRGLGTGRLLGQPDQSEPHQSQPHQTTVHIGRMAVRQEARGRRVGAALMAELEAIAAEQARDRGEGSVRIELSAQEHAMGFYASVGYRVVDGRSYLDAGIPHQDMAKTLSV